ncbi:hypothetical protein [Spirillospora sp. NBC_01491]|uniref:hypothetical protein n=1 Tax=Spirillospora sp. NBC_01491 TaxID=2976007 RepID=UPI002E2F5EBB|nr:hypothetical protein [Spirillospora sp. NBC_01491]
MRAPETVIPQSERVALLGGLARELDRAPGLITAFTVINSYVALDVVPVKAPEWAVTIGLVYFRGVWWFVYLRSGKAIWPANGVSAAAHQIRTQMEGKQRHDLDDFEVSAQATRPSRRGQRHDLR